MNGIMKYGLFVPLVVSFFTCEGQSNRLLSYQKLIHQQLQPWISSFHHFKLADFKAVDTLHFENNSEQDLADYKKFLAVYNPILHYSPDKRRFIDIYSYQLSLEKKGNIYYAHPDIDQAIFLYDPTRHYWKRIFFGTYSLHIEEAIWLSDTQFILAAVAQPVENIKVPVLFLGDIQQQSLIDYTTTDTTCQQNKVYQSPTLKKIRLRGL